MMFAEWVTIGVRLAVIIASAAFTLFVFAGFIIGLLSMIAYFTKGDRDEEKDKKDWDDFNHNRPA